MSSKPNRENFPHYITITGESKHTEHRLISHLQQQQQQQPTTTRETIQKNNSDDTFIENMRAYLTFAHGELRVGTLSLELYDQSVPQTVQSFCSLLQSNKYKDCPVHRLIPGFMLQTGDFEHHDGTGGYSLLFGKKHFDDENFVHSHDRPGMLSMANAGPNTNGSQFFITFRATPHLDGKHVVFGHVDLQQEGATRTLQALEQIRTGRDDHPLEPLRIVDCGMENNLESTSSSSASKRDIKVAASVANASMDQDEIELNDEDGDSDIDIDKDKDKNKGAGVVGVDGEHPTSAVDGVTGQQKQIVAEEEEEEEEHNDAEESSLSKSDALKRRLRKLKQKMNQARQLNQQAVKQEGERSTQQGAAQEKKRISAANEKAQQAIWAQQNAKALATASEAGVDAKHLTQQAVDSVAKAVAKAEKDELNRFSINDDYNPEGQFRNYQRNVRSLPRNKNNNKLSTNLASTETTFNPLEYNVDAEQERQGARRISQEMHRRIEKKQKREQKRKEREEDSGDVSYINQRNKRFNEKINRNYDKHTAEIRQNLERGTAL